MRQWPTIGAPLPLCFSQVLILKVVKVLYFDTVLQVFILKKLVRDKFSAIRRQEMRPMPPE